MGVFVWMLSGDNTITAQAVARQIVIPETNVLTGLLPTEKVFPSYTSLFAVFCRS